MNIGQLYTYYCGANATISLLNTSSPGIPINIGEAVAIQYSLNQNRLPLYGYNSAEYSAVADGQVLVNGRISLNYVSHEYLLAAIQGINLDALRNDIYANMTEEELITLVETANDPLAINALKSFYYGISNTAVQGQYNTNLMSNFGRPDQHNQSLDIQLKFGVDDWGKNSTLLTIKHVYFLGRSMSTLISEDPQIETYDFIGRTII